MNGSRAEKVAFILSLAALTWLHGFVTSQQRWFPTDYLLRAWYQSTATSSPPHFLQERVHEFSGVKKHNSGKTAEGLTLVAGMWADSATRPGLKLIDQEGEVLHRWEIDPVELFPDPPPERTNREPSSGNVHGVHLFRDGDVMFNISYVGTARIGPCGEPRWTLPVGSHHSLSRADDGSFWVPGGMWKRQERRKGESTSLPGLGRSVYHDRLLRISGSGEVLQEIDVLELLYENGLQRHLPKGSHTEVAGPWSGDITHLNDVEPLPDSLAEAYSLFEAGDLAVSLHHLDLVMVVEADSRRVRWHASHPFIQQHDPDFIGNGWIGVFDNNRDGTERGSVAGGSRIVALRPDTDSTQVLFPTSMSDPFYTEVQGKWQLLSNGNMLLTEAQAGRIVEVTPEGESVWEWAVEPTKDSLVPEITEGVRYDYSGERVSSWSCTQEPDRGE